MQPPPEQLRNETASVHRHRLRDFALYLGISFAVVSILLALFFNNAPWNLVMGWFGAILFTLILLGLLLDKSRCLLKTPRRWLWIAIFSVVHCVSFRFLLKYTEWSYGLGTTLLLVIEFRVLSALRDWKFPNPNAPKSNQPATPPKLL